jgi:hypothetical protein
MLRINKKIGISIIATAILVSGVVFYACQKEDVQSNNANIKEKAHKLMEEPPYTSNKYQKYDGKVCSGKGGNCLPNVIITPKPEDKNFFPQFLDLCVALVGTDANHSSEIISEHREVFRETLPYNFTEHVITGVFQVEVKRPEEHLFTFAFYNSDNNTLEVVLPIRLEP